MKSYTELLPPTKSEKHRGLKWEPAADNATSPVAGVLTIQGKRCFCRYRVEEFPADMPGRAFMLVKVDAGSDATEERYSCLVGARGVNVCECRGFYATGACKHLAALAELVRVAQL